MSAIDKRRAALVVGLKFASSEHRRRLQAMIDELDAEEAGVCDAAVANDAGGEGHAPETLPAEAAAQGAARPPIDLAELRRLAEAGHSKAEIGRMLQRPLTSIETACKRHGIATVDGRKTAQRPSAPTGFWTTERTAQLRRLFEAGMTCEAIGAALACSKNQVIGKVHRLGLERRPDAALNDVQRGRVRAEDAKAKAAMLHLT